MLIIVSLVTKENSMKKIILSCMFSFSIFACCPLVSQASSPSLYELVKQGDVGALKKALENGLELNEYLSMGETAFSNVAGRLNSEMLVLLLKNGADPNQSFGRTSVLDSVVRSNNMDNVIILLDNGADINNSYYKTKHDTEPMTTPLHEAVKKMNKDMIILLIVRGADLTAKDSDGKVPMDYFVSDSQSSQEFLDKSVSLIKLLKASRYGDFIKVKEAITEGANINGYFGDVYGLKSEMLMPALFNAVRNGFSMERPLTPQLEKNYYEITKFLVENKADLNYLDRVGANALFWAVRGGNAEIVKFLLEKKMDANHVVEGGETALMIASQNGNVVVMQALWDAGADPSFVEMFYGQTAFHKAISNNQIDAVKFFKQKGLPLPMPDENGNTALMLAKGTNNPEMIELIENY